KQVVLLGSGNTKRKGSDGVSFLAHEIDLIVEFNLPVVIANLDGDRTVDKNFIPKLLLDSEHYTVSVSFQPKIIKYALDNYCVNYYSSSNSGSYRYPTSVYTKLGL
ncbi:molecular chaperone Tir, partial [Escherichia coli]|nr:molecular chaperone Tir [Escherichia coli]